MIKILEYNKVNKEEFFSRLSEKVDVSEIVTDIIENVKANGDKALFEYCKKFDKADLTALEVTKEEIDEVFEKLDDAIDYVDEIVTGD